MAEERTGTLEGAGGVRVFFRGREVKVPRGRLFVAHGLGEHSGRYGLLAEAITAAGLDYYALDLRGHGRSAGRRGHANSLDRHLQDLDRLRRRVGGSRPPAPTFLLGHSLGGLIVGRYVQEFGFPGLAGAVLVAPFIELAMRPPAWKVRLGAVADRIAPALSLDNELESEDLFREPEERRSYDDDPLVHRRISARLWGEMLRNSERLSSGTARVAVPVLVQLPGEDRVVNSAATLRVVERLGDLAVVREYPDAYHALFHDPRAGEARTDVIHWLEDRLSNR